MSPGPPGPACGPVLWRRVYRASWEVVPFGEPPWPARSHGECLCFPHGPGWLPRSERWFCVLPLATPASSPLEYSERKVSARRRLLWVFLRRSDLENSDSRGERNFVMFSFPTWEGADGSWCRDCGSDIFVLTEVQPFYSACFGILCTGRLHRALTDLHNGGKIPWHFRSEALFCLVFMDRKERYTLTLRWQTRRVIQPPPEDGESPPEARARSAAGGRAGTGAVPVTVQFKARGHRLGTEQWPARQRPHPEGGGQSQTPLH